MVLVGGGAVAYAKLAELVRAGARVTVVAPAIRPEITSFDGLIIVQREFVPRDLDDAWFVVAAASPEVNRRVAAAAEERHVFVNAVDDATRASAYAGGVFRKGGVTIAVSTEGRAPALAGLLREGLEAWYRRTSRRGSSQPADSGRSSGPPASRWANDGRSSCERSTACTRREAST